MANLCRSAVSRGMLPTLEWALRGGLCSSREGRPCCTCGRTLSGPPSYLCTPHTHSYLRTPHMPSYLSTPHAPSYLCTPHTQSRTGTFSASTRVRSMPRRHHYRDGSEHHSSFAHFGTSPLCLWLDIGCNCCQVCGSNLLNYRPLKVSWKSDPCRAFTASSSQSRLRAFKATQSLSKSSLRVGQQQCHMFTGQVPGTRISPKRQAQRIFLDGKGYSTFACNSGCSGCATSAILAKKVTLIRTKRFGTCKICIGQNRCDQKGAQLS